MIRRIGVITSGGDSPGMNPAIRAIVRAARSESIDIVGIKDGYQGIFDHEFVHLSPLEVSGKIRDAGTFLGSSRCKYFREDKGQEEAIKIMKAEGIQGLIVIGGDGSLTGAQKLHEKGFPVVGIPGSIDNDIYGTDLSLGVDTCLNTIISLIDMIKATASSHRRCFVVEVMGRNCGYLAMMAAITSAAQVAVLPEFPVNMQAIVESLDKRFRSKYRNGVIIVSEGVCTGQEFMDRLHAEAGEEVKQDLRLTVLGHVQRGGSPTNFDRLLGSRMGEMALQTLAKGESGVMMGIQGLNIAKVKLEDVISQPKTLNDDLIRLARNLGVEVGFTQEALSAK
jgi:6-phosphofructokinase 1